MFDFFKKREVKRSAFDLSGHSMFTCSMGKLLPIMCDEVLPGDIFKAQSNMIVRFQALLTPLMHEVNVYTHFWYVPTRLLMNYDDYEAFMTGGRDGKSDIPAPFIKFDPAKCGVGSLWDYFGLPTDLPNDFEVLAYPFRAYNMIFNEWYRDQNLQDEVKISLGTGHDTETSIELLNRCWEKDYFTSCLPTPQRGEGVNIPLADTAPVIGNGGVLGVTDGSGEYGLIGAGVNPAAQGVGVIAVSGASGKNAGDTVGNYGNYPGGNKAIGLSSDPNKSGLIADLKNATSISARELRQAMQVQVFQEMNARGGSRLREFIQNHFGVRVSDSRLMVPEYLGGGRSPVVVSEVLQTSSTDSTSPQGNLAGHAISVQSSHSFKRKFEEHGYVIGLLSIMPKTAYMQGVRRMWNRRSRYDFALPVFSHLGEQAVLKKEIYGKSADPDGVFGYQPQYEDYRHGYSYVAGQFRDTMDYWHLARKFDNEPQLNEEFVKCKPSKRPFAVTDSTVDSCMVEIYRNVKALRPLPKFGTPGMMDMSM